MVKLIQPLDMLSKDMLDYFQERARKATGTEDVHCILITKVGDQVQMRDTFKEGSTDMQIMMMEGIVAALKAKKVVQ
jgi:hypothetical protein